MNKVSEITSILKPKNSWKEKINYLQNKYAIALLAITWKYYKNKDWLHFVIENTSMATSSIIYWLDKEIIKNNNDNVEIHHNSGLFVFNKVDISNSDITFGNYEKMIQEICTKYKEENKTVFIWFSSLWWFKLMPRVWNVIKNLKEKNDNVIFVIWWADYNWHTDKELLETTLEYWFDLINIWWAKEFIEFISKLDNKNSFYRDKKQVLHFTDEDSIPKNIITQKNLNSEDSTIWNKVFIPFHIDYWHLTFDFTINDNPCLNKCWYCALVNEQGNNCKKTYDLKKTISEFNTSIKIAKKHIRKTRANKNTMIKHIWISWANPFQQIHKYSKFLLNIDLKWIHQIDQFGDFIWMWNENNYNIIIDTLEKLLEKRPKLTIFMRFWIDALHEKWDWDFIERTHFNKIASEEKLQKWLKNFDRFYNRFKDNKRIKFDFNLLFHPNLNVKDFIERLDFFKQYIIKKESSGWTLIPHLNTKIWNKYRWFYIPEHEIVKKFDFIKWKVKEANLWGLDFKNSELLDIYEISAELGFSKEVFKDLSKCLDDEEFESLPESEKAKFVKESPFIQTLRYYTNDIKIHIKNKNKKIIYAIPYIEYLIEYINIMIYRENYIIKVNPNYKSDYVVSTLTKLKKTKSTLIKVKKDIEKLNLS